MKAPRYPLQTVMDQRGREKEAAKKAFAQSIKDLEAEQLKKAKLEEERKGLERRREEMIAHVYDPEPDGMLGLNTIDRRRSEVQYMVERIKEKGIEIEEQTKAVARAEENVEAKKAQLVEADKGLKAMEKHHEAWLAEWKREMALKEQKLSEEITLARFVKDAAEAAEEQEE